LNTLFEVSHTPFMIVIIIVWFVVVLSSHGDE